VSKLLHLQSDCPCGSCMQSGWSRSPINTYRTTPSTCNWEFCSTGDPHRYQLKVVASHTSLTFHLAFGHQYSNKRL